MDSALEREMPRARSAPPRRSIRVSPTGAAALVVLGFIVVAALLGPRIWGHDPLAQHVDARLQQPSLTHPLGTDRFGRDLLARLLTGARWSLAGATIVCVGTSALGFLMGALAAIGGRLVDTIIGRLIESLMAVPGLVAALALTAVLGPSFKDLLFALVVTHWPSYARVYRALILRERSAQYVEGTVAVGATRGRIVFRYLLPNVIGPTAVIATSNFGHVILSLASLSFLGLGMQPPTPEWGVMINEARGYFQRFPWQMIAPGLCIALTVLSVNLTGDALRDALDPRSSRSHRPMRGARHRPL